MAPRQIIPNDECGSLRTPRNLLGDGSELVVVQHERRKEQWADCATPVENVPPYSSMCMERDVWDPQHPSPIIDDLHDALDDDDDDELNGDASLELGSNWASREFVPKRGVEIFVGGLTRSTRRDMLREWFQHAGEVTEVRIARDKRRRRCRGYGYVRFATSEEANRAIDTMHRYEFKHGRFLGVLPSDENRTLFVGGLREEWSCEYISRLLKQKMPGLRKVEPIPDREDRFKIRTFCFLEFESHAEAAVIFNRHHTTPLRPTHPQPPQASASSPVNPGQIGPDMLTPSKNGAAGGGGSGGGGGGGLYERESRAVSMSTCTTSCASNGGCGDWCCGDRSRLSSTATTATAPTSASPEVGCEGVASGIFGFDAGGLGSSLWSKSNFVTEEDNHVGGGSNGSFPRTDNSAAGARPTASGKDYSDDRNGGAEDVDGEEVGTRSDGTIPLVVGGATLKVDWADPLRYHIHLNGGIKGPSSPPDGAVAGSRPPSRSSGGGGSGGGGRGGRDVAVARGGSRNSGGSGSCSSWQQQADGVHRGLVRHPSAPPVLEPRWQDGEQAGMTHDAWHERQQHQSQYQHQHHTRHYSDSFGNRRAQASYVCGGNPGAAIRGGRFALASVTTPSERWPPFTGVGGGGMAGDAEALADDLPRSRSSSSHGCTSHRRDGLQPRLISTTTGAVGYGDPGEVTHRPTSRAYQRDQHARPHPHRVRDGDPGELQEHFTPRMVVSPSSGFPQHFSEKPSTVNGAGLGRRQGSPVGHHHQHRGGGGGGGATPGLTSTRRTFTVNPVVSGGRHGSLGAYANDSNGSESRNGDGDYDVPQPRGSTSSNSYGCRQQHYRHHHHHQHEQLSGGGGRACSGRRGTTLSPSPPLSGIMAGLPAPSHRETSDWSRMPGSLAENQVAELARSQEMRDNASSTTRCFGGEMYRRQKQHQWEHGRPRDLAIDLPVTTRLKELPPALPDEAPNPAASRRTRSSPINARDPAVYASFNPCPEQQQQQQPEEPHPIRFSDAVAISSSLNSRARRLASPAGLTSDLADVGTHIITGTSCPPGFSLNCRADVSASATVGESGVKNGRWIGSCSGSGRVDEDGRHASQGKEALVSWIAPLQDSNGAGAAAAIAAATETLADTHIGTGLWESLGSGGFDNVDASSWHLSSEETRGVRGSQPWHF